MMNFQTILKNFIEDNELYLVIPSRMASTRLPNKVLMPLGDDPMIIRTFKQIKVIPSTSSFVLTEDNAIVTCCNENGVPSILSKSGFKSGTERISDWALHSNIKSNSIIVNVQADEPFINPYSIFQAIQLLIQNEDVGVGTLWTRADLNEAESPHRVKVVTNTQNQAIYFSRSVIPNHTRSSLEEPTFKIHQGIYAYRKWALDQFINLKDELAEIEKLEQLKFIQSGIPISITESKYPSSLGIDTINDYNKALSLI